MNLFSFCYPCLLQSGVAAISFLCVSVHSYMWQMKILNLELWAFLYGAVCGGDSVLLGAPTTYCSQNYTFQSKVLWRTQASVYWSAGKSQMVRWVTRQPVISTCAENDGGRVCLPASCASTGFCDRAKLHRKNKKPLFWVTDAPSCPDWRGIFMPGILSIKTHIKHIEPERGPCQ